jgi:hypothetical protein
LLEVAEKYQELVTVTITSHSAKTVEYKTRVQSSYDNITPMDFGVRAKQIVEKVIKQATDQQRFILTFLHKDLLEDVAIEEIYNSFDGGYTSLYGKRRHTKDIVNGTLEYVAESLGYSLAPKNKKQRSAA